MKKTLCIILIMLLSVFCSCNVYVVKQNYLDAADVAKKYIENLLILNDYTAAYHMMTEEFKTSLSQAQIKELAVNCHKNNFPKELKIDGFETYSGQELSTLISIFLVTKNYSPQLYYRVALEGTEKKGYLVAGLHISTEPIPAKGRRLPIEPVIAIGGA